MIQLSNHCYPISYIPDDMQACDEHASLGRHSTCSSKIKGTQSRASSSLLHGSILWAFFAIIFIFMLSIIPSQALDDGELNVTKNFLTTAHASRDLETLHWSMTMSDRSGFESWEPPHRSSSFRASDSCTDDPSWTYVLKNGSVKHCRYVAKKPAKRCQKTSVDGQTAYEGCPHTCDDACCVDDNDWRHSDQKGTMRNCAWVGRKPDKRCGKKGEDGTKAKHSCRVACGKCTPPPPSSSPGPSSVPTTTSSIPSRGPSMAPSTKATMFPSGMPSTFSSHGPSSTPSSPMPTPVNDHMRHIFRFWRSYRDPRNGLWCDNLAFSNTKVCGDTGSWTYEFYSAASVGWGLVSDAIFTELGLWTWDEGYARAHQTLTSCLNSWPKDSNFGYYNHFTNAAYQPMAEYSTIDTALLIAGSEFVGNYFGGSLRDMAEQMFAAVNFRAAIDPDLYPAIYATAGVSSMSGRFVAPYNEYYIVAYLAQRWESMFETSTYARTYFETYYNGVDGNSKPVGAHGHPVDVSYDAHNAVLSDHGGFVASFIPLFCWYATRAFRANEYYGQMTEQWIMAERGYWATLDGRYPIPPDGAGMFTWGTNVTGRVYGSAAGDCPRSAYCVSQIRNTQANDDTWSAAIMAGFLGPLMGKDNLRNQVLQDVEWLYEHEICTYTKAYSDPTTNPWSKVLWRCSVNPAYSEWRADRPTSVDFSTLVFGYATNFLRPDFWDLYSM